MTCYFINNHFQLQVLETLLLPATVAICEFLLQKLASLRNIIFVVRFLLQKASSALTPHRIKELGLLELGANVVLLLPLPLHESVRQLLPRPDRILEQLLMNKHVEEAANILSQVCVCVCV